MLEQPSVRVHKLALGAPRDDGDSFHLRSPRCQRSYRLGSGFRV